jgi:hypothetical protein
MHFAKISNSQIGKAGRVLEPDITFYITLTLNIAIRRPMPIIYWFDARKPHAFPCYPSVQVSFLLSSAIS